jgi:hypothetical protein
MIKHLGIVALALGFVVVGSVPSSEAVQPQKNKAMRGSAQWTTDPPSPCGPFSALLVHSTQGDADVVEIIYQSGDTCQGTFTSLQGRGLPAVDGNINKLTMNGSVPADDGRVFEVNLTLTRTRDFDNNGPSERVVSASARGTVILDGMDLTGGVPTTNATISKSKT